MRMCIPDTWAFFFGIVLVKNGEEMDLSEPIGVDEFIRTIGEIRVYDEVKYRQRYLFFKESH